MLQDKESKVAYLAKITAVVSLALNRPVPAKPLKVRLNQLAPVASGHRTPQVPVILHSVQLDMR